MQVLYNTDCVSDQAIIYWHQKGSKPNGRQHFLKQTEGLVKVSLRTCLALHLRLNLLASRPFRTKRMSLTGRNNMDGNDGPLIFDTCI